MNYFERRRLRQAVQELLHEAKRVRHMRCDIAAPEILKKLTEAEETLQNLWRQKAFEQIDAAAEDLAQCMSDFYPNDKHRKWKDWAEFVVVVLVVVMAIRAYFFQPFKIPTGSMQPTLYGITYEPQAEQMVSDRFPLNIFKFVILGKRYVDVKAKEAGPVSLYNTYDGKIAVYINGRVGPHIIEQNMHLHVTQGQSVKKGHVLASGIKRAGDHILVNKIVYNFSKPKRGNIFVFSTKDIPGTRENTFYIKRLAGLPSDTVSIHPPYLLINGEKMTEPYPFTRIVEEEGYHGYTLPRSQPQDPALLKTSSAQLTLSDSEYFPLGDNSRNSKDGRFFGAVPEKNIVGEAFAIYWPFKKSWGWVQ
ncbi:MAG: signal peptidase I [Kiritimatiellae bacterium]|nr:signal peptidase I [Kiritimatiellia bacterium]